MMRKRPVCITLLILLCAVTASAQKKPAFTYRFGASVSFGLTAMADNTVGIGAIAGVERKIKGIFAAEAEAGYTYFTGDQESYEYGRNNASAIPAVLGLKAYILPQAYVSARAGAIWFGLNDMPKAAIRPTYGLATGFNLPKKVNRVNEQGGYTWFRYAQHQRGYATVAASIIIN